MANESEEKMFPAAVLADQEAIISKTMEPVVFGPPPYSSDNPETEQGLRMTSVTSGVSTSPQVADEDKKAGDWVDAVKLARTQEELDDVASRYAESDKDFSSVEAAIDKRQDEITEEENAAAETEEEEA